MSFATDFFLAILVLAPASRSAGRALESTFCFEKKVEACVRPGGFHLTAYLYSPKLPILLQIVKTSNTGWRLPS